MLPEELSADGHRIAEHVGHGVLVPAEGRIGGQRESDRRKLRRPHVRAGLEDANVVGQPEARPFLEVRIELLEPEVSRPLEGEVHIPHGHEGRAYDHPHAVRFRLHEHANRYIGGDLVRLGSGRNEQKKGEADQKAPADDRAVHWTSVGTRWLGARIGSWHGDRLGFSPAGDPARETVG